MRRQQLRPSLRKSFHRAVARLRRPLIADYIRNARRSPNHRDTEDKPPPSPPQTQRDCRPRSSPRTNNAACVGQQAAGGDGEANERRDELTSYLEESSSETYTAPIVNLESIRKTAFSSHFFFSFTQRREIPAEPHTHNKHTHTHTHTHIHKKNMTDPTATAAAVSTGSLAQEKVGGAARPFGLSAAAAAPSAASSSSSSASNITEPSSSSSGAEDRNTLSEAAAAAAAEAAAAAVFSFSRFSSASDGSASSSSTARRTSPGLSRSSTVKQLIVGLNKDIARLKKHGNPSFSTVQSLAERTWKANLEYEAHMARLEREKQELGRLIDSTWQHFDTLIRPLWRIDDELVPAYDALSGILTRLEDLFARQTASAQSLLRTAAVAVEDLSFEVRDQEQELWALQESLHTVENRHVVDGKFYGAGDAAQLRAAAGAPGTAAASGAAVASIASQVPGGQALLANLLARCHRAFRAALAAGVPVDPAELRMLQGLVDAVDQSRVDGKFVAPTSSSSSGQVLEGQAILSELLNEAYDLIHDCLVEFEAQQEQAAKLVSDYGEGTAAKPDRQADPLESAASSAVGIRDALLGLAFVSGESRPAGTASANQRKEVEKNEDGDDTEFIEVIAVEVEGKQRPPAYANLLGSGPALHSLADALFSSFATLRNAVTVSLPKTNDAAGVAVAQDPTTEETTVPTLLSSSAARLAAALRSGLGMVGSALGAVDPVDPSLVPLRDQLVVLRSSLTAARNRRNQQRLAAAAAAAEAAPTSSSLLDSTAGPSSASAPADAVEAEDADERAMRWRREWTAAAGGGSSGSGDRLEIRTQLARLDEIDSERDSWGNFVDAEGRVPRGQAVLKALLDECYCLAYDLVGY
ncbi:hypothetical protein DFJ73DRAFT_961560 [Zopfochytrium polystomum]|nr:hypothetical protein DFJ73DRAFT_961560 [Zopfochytrium polystomum]